jgi:hypothetical protein
LSNNSNFFEFYWLLELISSAADFGYAFGIRIRIQGTNLMRILIRNTAAKAVKAVIHYHTFQLLYQYVSFLFYFCDIFLIQKLLRWRNFLRTSSVSWTSQCLQLTDQLPSKCSWGESIEGFIILHSMIHNPVFCEISGCVFAIRWRENRLDT